MIECMRNAARKPRGNAGWIPVSKRLPEEGKYILISFENFSIPNIGRYETDEQGNGAFYPGDDEKPYIGYDMIVNAWMPLPEPYRESEEEHGAINQYRGERRNLDHGQ